MKYVFALLVLAGIVLSSVVSFAEGCRYVWVCDGGYCRYVYVCD